jgi:26S proteasome regulatory subunit N11
MLKHGRAGVPMEVMGLMLGEYIDEWTTQVVDVFAMPQSGTTVTVESVDHVFQADMLEMLKQTGRYVNTSPEHLLICSMYTVRPEMVVGWYHSHPGFGCWLSSVDINTQQVRRFFFPFTYCAQVSPDYRSPVSRLNPFNPVQ